MQPGFFDHQERLELLERLGDPLPKLERSVDWEAFRPLLESLYKRKRLANYIYPVPVVIVMMTSPFIDISRADYDSELIQKSGQPPGLV
jgi:hypothetical protein